MKPDAQPLGTSLSQQELHEVLAIAVPPARTLTIAVPPARTLAIAVPPSRTL